MKSWKIVLFIFSVIAVLGVLCAFFPAGGLNIGPVNLRMCSIESVLNGTDDAEPVEEPEESPEELLARRLAELRADEEADFQAFMSSNPARIHFPDGDASIWDSFFESLDSASVRHLRIVHYGDSQLEEDRITNIYRSKLQERFGGNGVGLVSLMQTAYTLTTRQTRSGSLLRSMAFGSTKEFSVNGKYGPMAQACRLAGPYSFSFLPSAKTVGSNPSLYFTKVTLITDTLRKPVSFTWGEKAAELDTVPSALRRYRLELPDSTSKATFRLNGSADLYGIMLDSEKGVSVDNVALRGCSGTIFTNINADQLKDFYQGENVRLIILQFGGNAMPYLRVGKSAADFGAKIERQIRYVREQAPDAAILFIGPSDMSTNLNGTMQTYPSLPGVVDTLRNCANRAGAAYWDLYRVMGGKNSMKTWVKTGLAGPDYIHFSHRGAEKVGNLFYESLMFYYDYYKWRQHKEDEQIDSALAARLLSEPEDSVVAVSLE